MGVFSDIDVQMQGDSCVWFSTSSGRIELSIPYDFACKGYHTGQCYDDISELLETPLIKAQLMDISPELLRSELKEYGAWDELELAIHSDNLVRILWIACGDIVENKE